MVEFGQDPTEARDAASTREAFEATYEATYGLRLPDLPIEVVAWRLSATGPDIVRGTQSMTAAAPGAEKGEREIHAARDGERVKVHDRLLLAAGQALPGPVIIEERETTIFVMGGWTAHVGEDGCITARKES